MLIFLGVFAAYFLPFPLVVGGAPVVPTLLGTLLIGTGVRKGYRTVSRHRIVFLAILAFLVISSVVTPALNELWIQKLQTTSQLVLSLLLASFAFSELASRTRGTRETFYRICLILILCLATLEVLVPGLPAMLDSIRDLLYVREASAFVSRDIAAYGWVRPILLTAEPSYLAYSVAVFLSLLLLSSDETRQSKTKFFILLIFAALLIRSPVVLVLPLAAYTVVSYVRHPIATIKGLLVAVVVLILFVYGWSQVSDRPAAIMAGRDFSAFSRMFASVLLLVEYFPQSVFVGAGLGGEDSLLDSARSMYFSQGFGLRIRYMTDNEIVYAAMPSYFWQSWIYFGVIGGMIFIGLIFVYLKAHIRRKGYTNSYLFPLVLFAVGGLFVGRLAGLATWLSLMLIALELNHRLVFIRQAS